MDPNSSAPPGWKQRMLQPLADRMRAWSDQLPTVVAQSQAPARSLYEPNTIGGDRGPFTAWRNFEQKRLQPSSSSPPKQFSLASYNKSFTDIVCTAPG